MPRRASRIFLCLLISACATAPVQEHRQKREPCPPVALDTQLQTLTHFSAGDNALERRPVSTARLIDFDDACTLNARALIVDMRFILDGILIAPSSKPQTESYPYVLAVTDNTGRIVAERYYKAALSFQPGTLRQNAPQVLREAIPLQGRDPRNLQIAVGFAIPKTLSRGTTP